MRLGFVRWVSAAPSGGNRYDDRLVAGLRALGITVVERVLSGEEAAAGLGPALVAERHTLVDGILATRAPEQLADAVDAGRDVRVLVHHFGADQLGQPAAERAAVADAERAVLRAASGVLCPSAWAAAELDRRYGIPDAVVATPGVDPAAVAVGSRDGETACWLCVGSLTPTKDQLSLVEASRELGEAGWSAVLVGSDDVDPRYARQVRRAVRAAGLAERIAVPGAVVGPELDGLWDGSDLLICPSRSETYGMVVTEALARGIPAVVRADTGAVEALAAGRVAGGPLAGAVCADDPGALTGILEAWLRDEGLRRRWRAAALDQRDRLPAWSATAATVLDSFRAPNRDLEP